MILRALNHKREVINLPCVSAWNFLLTLAYECITETRRQEMRPDYGFAPWEEFPNIEIQICRK